MSKCYCGQDVSDAASFECTKCKGLFHEECLHSRGYSALNGDYLFLFTCAICNANGDETFERPKLSWLHVVHLALFNLQLKNSGRQGFFRWRDHICSFIGQHWETFFGTSRKKSGTWQSTISGTLSSNAPHIFQSGTNFFGEPGWWRLTTPVPPKLTVGCTKKRSMKAAPELSPASGSANADTNNGSNSHFGKKAKLSLNASLSSLTSLASSMSGPASPDDTDCCLDDLDINVEVDDTYADLPPLDLADVVQQELLPDIDRDPCQTASAEHECGSAMWSALPRSCASQLSTLDGTLSDDSYDSDSRSTTSTRSKSNSGRKGRGTYPTAMVPTSKECSATVANAQSAPVSGGVTPLVRPAQPAVQKAYTQASKNELLPAVSNKPAATPGPSCTTTVTARCTRMSVYREVQLLKELHDIVSGERRVSSRCARFFRKLALRKAKRDAGLPLFELSNYAKALPTDPGAEEVSSQNHGTTILDKYQVHPAIWRQSTPLSFSARLGGLGDGQLEPIRSPYTARLLKPYIWRTFDCLPAKLKLLNEIVAYHHRKDPSWSPPAQAPVDFCYVRPEHIPAINAMCHSFFWPGIDLSECLHYPDFSCVVLYKKLIVGFAFMVPDANFNEAYISFIFTHPDWRQAGIASFMLYHLIQTCMGKDISLHVSATNPAVMLYHKFGFKAQELILNFYDKYLSPDSADCRHALALKLEK